ncbi:histone H1-like [Anarhichas minor]|uniref:histone H1-like n=1 Tax=Anarhichas minor TaxID=65739 RepID=UPI003F7409A1
MAEVAPAPAAAKAARKGVSMLKGTTLAQLIVKVVSALDEGSGVSAVAVMKALTAGGYDVEKKKLCIKTAIVSLVTKRTLIQIKGTGASGSFKMNKTPPKARKPAAKKPTAAKKTKTAAGKKPAAAKKTKTAAGKKPAAAAKKSPKKAKKPAADKNTKTAAVKKHVCVMQPMGDGLSFSCMADCR